LVHVTSSAWIHHLQFLKKELVKRLNDDLGQPLVSDIKFKVGSF
jgi:predicted nucleic acid-binding Zn ribbon protein